MPLPITLQYTPENKPDWMTIIPEPEASTWTITLTVETHDRIKLDESGAEGIYINLEEALKSNLSATEMIALIHAVMISSPLITLVISGSGRNIYHIKFPTGIRIYKIVKAATGETVTFNYNEHDNSIVFTATLSQVEYQLMLVSTLNVLNTMLPQMITIVITIMMMKTLIKQIMEAIR